MLVSNFLFEFSETLPDSCHHAILLKQFVKYQSAQTDGSWQLHKLTEAGITDGAQNIYATQTMFAGNNNKSEHFQAILAIMPLASVP